MPDGNMIAERQRERQLLVARELQRRGYTLKSLSADSDIPYNTLRSYFPGERHAVPAVMPTCAFYQLCGFIPDEILSLLLPDGRRLVAIAEEIDHDAVCAAMHDYLAAKSGAHRPESPGGREITEGEDKLLRGKLAAIGGR